MPGGTLISGRGYSGDVADFDVNLPPKTYWMSRALRVLLFAFVAAALVVSMAVVAIQFIWNEFVAQALNRQPYEVYPQFVVPAILLIGLVFAKLIWDASNPRLPPRSEGPS